MLASSHARQSTHSAGVTPNRHVASSVHEAGARPVNPPDQLASLNRLDLSLVTTRAGLEALEADWNTLFAEAGRDIHLFQSFNWIWHWANHFLPPSNAQQHNLSLFIVTGRSGGRLALVCPFARYRRGGFTTLSFAGSPVSQYGDVLLDEQHDGQALLERAWSFIVQTSGADAISLRKVRADSNIAPFLSKARALITDRQIAPYLDLASAPDYDTYEQRYSSKSRKNRRRLLRRLEENGPTSVEMLSGGEHAADMAKLAISLKRAWLKQRGLFSPALANPATREFFASVTAATEKPVGAVVSYLTTRGEAAAIEVTIECKGRRAAHIIAYALKYERSSAGQILLESSFRKAMQSGMRVYDLMAPGDAYKLDWADDSVEVCDWAHGLTVRGRVFSSFYLGYARAKLKIAANTANRLVRGFMRRGASTTNKS
ncbi:MAG TPA: GNAT family N-acetyltransferase [Hyphomicrobiaceae bacterium]|nr:GNAT family N-acetyltransferase [Hyphomicrobiaceae bacterium]